MPPIDARSMRAPSRSRICIDGAAERARGIAVRLGGRTRHGSTRRRPEAALETGIAVFALLLVADVLIANRLDDLSIGPALAFVVVGFVIGPTVWDPPARRPRVDVGPTPGRGHARAVLVTDGSRSTWAGLRRGTSLIGRPP